MFSLLVGLGSLLLAVFVSIIFDPRPSRSGADDERARADGGCDHLIDEAVFATKGPWALKLHDNRHIGDFRAWKHHEAYRRALDRLLRDLRVETETT
jgi:hypothetical protein